MDENPGDQLCLTGVVIKATSVQAEPLRLSLPSLCPCPPAANNMDLTGQNDTGELPELGSFSEGQQGQGKPKVAAVFLCLPVIATLRQGDPG